ncbi:MAG: HAMP domain-containing protein, partial [Chloroflexi bacterium]
MFRNLKVFWKFAIVAFLIPVAVLVTAGSALVSTTNLKTEYDHLYGDSLAPIMVLYDGHSAIKTLMDDVYKLTRRGLPTNEFTTLADKARADEKKLLAAFQKYEANFASTQHPEFGPMLSGMGRLYLQNSEVIMMNQFKTAYQGYESQREMLLAGQIPDYAWMEGYLSQMETALSTLVAINRNYAEISNMRAQQVIGQMRAATILLALAACLVAMIITIAISRDVTIPLEKTARAIIEMGQGRLGNRLWLKRKDEIGVLAETMDAFAEDLQMNVIGSLNQIASGNLDIEITPKDSRDEISPALLKTVESL